MKPALVALLACALGACAGSSGSLSNVITIKAPNGQKLARGPLIDGMREGQWTYWYQYGQKHEQGSFRAGERHGEWKRWYQNGKLRSVSHYLNGTRHGSFVSHQRDGALFESGEFVHGRRQGSWIKQYPGGKGNLEIVYEGGVEVSRTRSGP